MAQDFDTIGIIAGNRSLPLVFARQARALGVKRLVAVAFENETSPELTALVDEIVWLKVGQLSKMISALKERGVSHCVMLGQIAPRNLFDLRPDFRALGLLIEVEGKKRAFHFRRSGGGVEEGRNRIDRAGALAAATHAGNRILPGTGPERGANG